VTKPSPQDANYLEAVKSVEKTLGDLRGCSDSERQHLMDDIAQLNEMYDKISTGRVEITIFGEISTGKSAMINALIGRAVAEGMESSEIVLIDTPGINEVGGADRAELAEVTARRSDLILFVTDSDLNETEYAALVELAAVQKPIIMVFNKIDLYPDEEKKVLTEMLKKRLDGLIPADHFVTTIADPREVEYVIEQPDGSEKVEWRKPEPEVEELKSMILETLEKEGLGLLALNAAMYAADKSDRISALRVSMRDSRADQVIWTMAATKAVVVAANPLPFVDIFGGLAVDALMIVTLSKVYGLSFSMSQARGLAKAISGAAGIYALGEFTNWGASAFKLITGTLGTALTMLPQGAAAGFTSYIIGRSWGAGSAKTVVKDILATTNKDSVVAHLKDEIKSRLSLNRHADK